MHVRRVIYPAHAPINSGNSHDNSDDNDDGDSDSDDNGDDGDDNDGSVGVSGDARPTRNLLSSRSYILLVQA
jgi:hypothetical protein